METENSQWLSGTAIVGKGLTAKEHERYLGGNVNTLYLDYDVGYIATYICQTSLFPDLKRVNLNCN